MNRKLLILGTRGIPAQYGGFETYAERLALYLVGKGWEVTVYCQVEGKELREKYWKGIRLVHIPVKRDNAIGSIIFDFKSTLHAIQEEGIPLVLGYNTAIFSLLYRLKGRVNLINMDGMEWQREKWSPLAKAWLYLNEHFGAWFGNHLIADHPEIKNYLCGYINPDKITVIPYGTEPLTNTDVSHLEPYGLVKGEYALVIARAEPENSILEIVSAFSQRQRGLKLFILGTYTPEECPYHQEVLAAASDEVIFPGAIYQKEVVQALRYHARLYIHGHRVGGTNPSLVEALAANNPVLAHDNAFNRWVAGSGARFFSNEADCAAQLEQCLAQTEELSKMQQASRKRYQEAFAQQKDLEAYEDLFLAQLYQIKKSAKSTLRQWIE